MRAVLVGLTVASMFVMRSGVVGVPNAIIDKMWEEARAHQMAQFHQYLDDNRRSLTSLASSAVELWVFECKQDVTKGRRRLADEANIPKELKEKWDEASKAQTAAETKLFDATEARETAEEEAKQATKEMETAEAKAAKTKLAEATVKEAEIMVEERTKNLEFRKAFLAVSENKNSLSTKEQAAVDLKNAGATLEAAKAALEAAKAALEAAKAADRAPADSKAAAEEAAEAAAKAAEEARIVMKEARSYSEFPSGTDLKKKDKEAQAIKDAPGKAKKAAETAKKAAKTANAEAEKKKPEATSNQGGQTTTTPAAGEAAGTPAETPPTDAAATDPAGNPAGNSATTTATKPAAGGSGKCLLHIGYIKSKNKQFVDNHMVYEVVLNGDQWYRGRMLTAAHFRHNTKREAWYFTSMVTQESNQAINWQGKFSHMGNQIGSADNPNKNQQWHLVGVYPVDE